MLNYVYDTFKKVYGQLQGTDEFANRTIYMYISMCNRPSCLRIECIKKCMKRYFSIVFCKTMDKKIDRKTINNKRTKLM